MKETTPVKGSEVLNPTPPIVAQEATAPRGGLIERARLLKERIQFATSAERRRMIEQAGIEAERNLESARILVETLDVMNSRPDVASQDTRDGYILLYRKGEEGAYPEVRLRVRRADPIDNSSGGAEPGQVGQYTVSLDSGTSEEFNNARGQGRKAQYELRADEITWTMNCSGRLSDAVGTLPTAVLGEDQISFIYAKTEHFGRDSHYRESPSYFPGQKADSLRRHFQSIMDVLPPMTSTPIEASVEAPAAEAPSE